MGIHNTSSHLTHNNYFKMLVLVLMWLTTCVYSHGDLEIRPLVLLSRSPWYSTPVVPPHVHVSQPTDLAVVAQSYVLIQQPVQTLLLKREKRDHVDEHEHADDDVDDIVREHQALLAQTDKTVRDLGQCYLKTMCSLTAYKGTTPSPGVTTFKQLVANDDQVSLLMVFPGYYAAKLLFAGLKLGELGSDEACAVMFPVCDVKIEELRDAYIEEDNKRSKEKQL